MKSTSKQGVGSARRQRSYGKFQGRRPASRPRFRAEDVDITAFYTAHVNTFKVRDSGYGWGLCPFHDDRNPSFSVNLRSGRYECRSTSCGVAGRGFVSFVACLYGYTVEEAKRYLEQWQ